MPKYNFKAYRIQNFQTQDSYIVLHDTTQNAAFIVGKLTGERLHTPAGLKKLNLHKMLQRDPNFPAENKQTAAAIKQRNNGIYKLKTFDPKKLRANKFNGTFKAIDVDADHDTFFRTLKANVLKTFGALNVDFSEHVDESQVHNSTAALNGIQLPQWGKQSLSSSNIMSKLSDSDETPSGKNDATMTKSEPTEAEILYEVFNSLVKRAGIIREQLDEYRRSGEDNAPKENGMVEPLSRLNVEIVDALTAYNNATGSQESLYLTFLTESTKNRRPLSGESEVLWNLYHMEKDKHTHGFDRANSDRQSTSPSKSGVRVDTSGPYMPFDGSPIDLSEPDMSESTAALNRDWQPVNPNVSGQPLNNHSPVTPGGDLSISNAGSWVMVPPESDNDADEDKKVQSKSATPGNG